MSDIDEMRAIERDLASEERAFRDISERIADCQDWAIRQGLLARLDARRRNIACLRSDLRLCAERLKP